MYKIIIYKLIIFKVKQNNREITKRYFNKIKVINDIDIKELSNKNIELKKIYRDSSYIFSILKNEEKNDWYIENLNEKSKKDYKQLIESRL